MLGRSEQEESRTMTRSNSLDTGTRGEDRGDSTPGPEGKRHGTDTPPPRSARDPAEGRAPAPDDGTSADRHGDAARHAPSHERSGGR
jgi:hypothetical protein